MSVWSITGRNLPVLLTRTRRQGWRISVSKLTGVQIVDLVVGTVSGVAG